jgi:hypothetical protein
MMTTNQIAEAIAFSLLAVLGVYGLFIVLGWLGGVYS